MSPKAEVEEKKVTVKREVITAVYKLNLHCQQCATHVKKPLLATQGVHSVIVDVDKGELKVKGAVDVKEIHKVIERISKRKVEIVASQNEATKKIEVKETEVKQEIVRTTSIKVHLHCTKCEIDLKKKLLKHKGIHLVKTDTDTQTVTIQGTIESEKLLAYMRKRVHKRAEIIVSEKKAEKKVETKCSDEKEETVVETKVEDKCSGGDDEDCKEISTTTTTTKVTETKCSCRIERFDRRCSRCTACIVEVDVDKTVCVQHKEGGAPYFIHYVYAPQLFSDENPNACSLM